jgi:hypothetical protein
VPFLALLAAVVAALLWARPRSASRGARALWIAGSLVVPAALFALLAWRWYAHRPQPEPLATTPLFRGITYERDVRTTPRPMVAHVVTIDLTEPSLSFLVTPLEEGNGGVPRAMTTSEFLGRYHMKLAVNGDFFLPWWSDGPTDYYPHAGQPTDVLGMAISGRDVYGWQVTPYSSLVIAPGGGVSIVEITSPSQPFPPAVMAVSGKQILVDRGARTPACTASEQARVTHPRTAAALDRTGRKLLLFAIDGRQHGYSEGATLDDLATIILDHGGFRAMNMDGGGSTSLIVDDGEGGTRALNVPYHTRIPWRERPVANHLGVFVAPLD